MATAAADATRYAIAEQSVVDVIPTGVWDLLQPTSDSLRQDLGFIDDPTLIDDRSTLDDVLTSRKTSGAINCAFRFATYDKLLRAVLWSNQWATPFPGETPVTNSTISVAVGGTAPEFAFTAGSSIFGPFALHEIIEVTGAKTQAVNGTHRVTITGTTTMTTVRINGTAAAVETSGQPILIQRVGTHHTSGVTLTATGGGLTATIDIADATAATAFVALGYFKVFGYVTNATNNGIHKVVSTAGSVLTLSHGTGEALFVTETRVIDWMFPTYIQNGKVATRFAIEKRFELPAPVYELYNWEHVDTANFNLAIGQFFDASFGFAGASQSNPNADSGTTYVAPPQSSALNAVRDVRLIHANGTVLNVASIGLQIANNVQSLERVGKFGAFDVIPGSYQFTGSAQAYLEDATRLDQFVNETVMPFELLMQNSAYQGLIFRAPRMKFKEAPTPATGRNTPVFTQLQFGTYKDNTLGWQTRIYRYL